MLLYSFDSYSKTSHLLVRCFFFSQVKFLRPLEDDSGKDFFNVFVLHQVCNSLENRRRKKKKRRQKESR